MYLIEYLHHGRMHHCAFSEKAVADTVLDLLMEIPCILIVMMIEVKATPNG